MTAASLFDRSVFARPIAHRGLHDTRAGRIENSGPAFQAAIASGYGIECDLRPLSDGTPVVFHDETLGRLVDIPDTITAGLVSDLSPSDLGSLRYRGTSDPVLTFESFLSLVGGAVPLLAEIKSEWEPPNMAFLGAIARLACAYKGPLAVMSFDPSMITPFMTLAPTIPRGLVSGSYGANGGDWWAAKLSPERADRLRRLADMDAAGASFAAYEVGALPTPATDALRARGIPVLAWTVRTADDFDRAQHYADAPIFEGMAPSVPKRS